MGKGLGSPSWQEKRAASLARWSRHLGFPECRAGARTRALHLLAGAAPRPPCAREHRAEERQAGAHAEDTDARGCRSEGRDSQFTMAELLRSLQDSQLVARFQRRCGLFPAREDNPQENGAAGPSERATRVSEVAHLPTNSQVTAGRCLPWGRGLRSPGHLRARGFR